MSIDYRAYEVMARHGSPAARWWKTGDAAYYVGLATVLLLFPVAGLHNALFRLGLLPAPSRPVLAYAVALVFGVLLSVGGQALKAHAYRIAAREGIDVNEYP